MNVCLNSFAVRALIAFGADLNQTDCSDLKQKKWIWYPESQEMQLASACVQSQF